MFVLFVETRQNFEKSLTEKENLIFETHRNPMLGQSGKNRSASLGPKCSWINKESYTIESIETASAIKLSALWYLRM